jgi:hypothetical protein
MMIYLGCCVLKHKPQEVIKGPASNCPVDVNRLTAIRVPAGTKNSHFVGFLR